MMHHVGWNSHQRQIEEFSMSHLTDQGRKEYDTNTYPVPTLYFFFYFFFSKLNECIPKKIQADKNGYYI